MSATGRGKKLDEDELYETPDWATRAIVRRLWPDGAADQSWLEPSAGNGAIVRAVRACGIEPAWTVVEILDKCQEPLRALVPDGAVWWTDFFGSPAGQPLMPYDAVIMNPPYSRAREFVETCLPLASRVVTLLRLNWLGSKRRADFLRRHAPDVYVLPTRPRFIAGKGSDASEYAWMVWRGDKPRRSGTIEILDLPE